MSQNLARNQHYVPKGYLKSWCIPETQRIHLYDLQDGGVNERNIGGKDLAEDWFYEEDQSNPDNRVENKMAYGTENRFGKLRSELDAVCNDQSFNHTNFKEVKKNLEEFFNEDRRGILTEFAAHQYLRVPDAIEQKQEELGTVMLDGSISQPTLNSGIFVETGYQYVAERFAGCTLALYVSFCEKFITSDRPVIDFNQSLVAPQLGEDFGKDDGTVAYMPLKPQIGVLFLPETVANKYRQKNQANFPKVLVNLISPSDVRNHNSTLIQGAKRFIVTQDSSPWVFKVASKGKEVIGNKQKLNICLRM